MTSKKTSKPARGASKSERVQLAVKIRPETLKALRIAAAGRSTDRIEPYQQRDIVDQALEQWLRKHRLWRGR